MLQIESSLWRRRFQGCCHRQREDLDDGSSPAARLSRFRGTFFFPVFLTGVLTATCGTELDNDAFAVGCSTVLLTGVLTAKCGTKFDYGVLAVGNGTVLLAK